MDQGADDIARLNTFIRSIALHEVIPATCRLIRHDGDERLDTSLSGDGPRL